MLERTIEDYIINELSPKDQSIALEFAVYEKDGGDKKERNY